MGLNVKGITTSRVDMSPKKSLFICLLIIVVAWILVFWQGLITAIDVWLVSDIFNHCLFVLPGSLFLIYLKRYELDLNYFKPNYFVLLFCTGSLILYAIGLAGDVQLFMHVATFTFLPLIIWAFIGNHLALKILFPLVFMLFCIPIGEELIPALQEVTADLSMVMLNWTGIPIYRNGLFIEIPQGRFLVAEACSGISFFIASIVIGSLYAYLNIHSTKRRVAFLLISIAFPIIANGIRVFGIILTGYLTDMEQAVGADHLIYGWVFFSLVLVCLLGIGELIREKQLPAINHYIDNFGEEKLPCSLYYQSLTYVVILMLVFSIWFKMINSQINLPIAASNLLVNLSEHAKQSGYKSTWKPEFNEPSEEVQYRRLVQDSAIDVYLAWYPIGHGELITSLNRLYTEKSWTMKSSHSFQLDTGQTMPITTIVNHNSNRLLSFWYVIDGEVFTNKSVAKLYKIYRILMGSHIGSGIVAVSQQTESFSAELGIASFQIIIQKHMAELNQHFRHK
jgi:exosortase A